MFCRPKSQGNPEASRDLVGTCWGLVTVFPVNRPMNLTEWILKQGPCWDLVAVSPGAFFFFDSSALIGVEPSVTRKRVEDKNYTNPIQANGGGD